MYKVEPYLAQCLDSILSQSSECAEIEIIAVDDGSPDRSGEIAEKYALNDPRIKVVRRTNGGLSEARNTGLKHSTGEYVWFIDSDDWIAPDSISEIASTILSANRPEAVHICGADVTEEGEIKLFSLKKTENNINTGMYMLKSGNFHGVVQYTVYRKDFLEHNNLSFKPGIFHEDTEFSPKAYYYLKTVASIDKVLYLKRVNDDSITRRCNPKKNRDLVTVSKSLRDFALSLPNETDRKFFMRRAANVLKMALTNEVHLMDRQTRKEFNRYLHANRDAVEAFLKSGSKIYRYEGLILKLFSHNMLFAYYDVMLNPIVRRMTNRKEKFTDHTIKERWLAKRP